MNVGEAIGAACMRACELEETAPRRLTVRLMTRYSGSIESRTGVLFREGETQASDVPLGLLIRAHVASRNKHEQMMQHQSSAQECLIFWEDIDARAGELVSIVEQCVAAAEAALGIVRDPKATWS